MILFDKISKNSLERFHRNRNEGGLKQQVLKSDDKQWWTVCEQMTNETRRKFNSKKERDGKQRLNHCPKVIWNQNKRQFTRSRKWQNLQMAFENMRRVRLQMKTPWEKRYDYENSCGWVKRWLPHVLWWKLIRHNKLKLRYEVEKTLE